MRKITLVTLAPERVTGTISHRSLAVSIPKNAPVTPAGHCEAPATEGERYASEQYPVDDEELRWGFAFKYGLVQEAG